MPFIENNNTTFVINHIVGVTGIAGNERGGWSFTIEMTNGNTHKLHWKEKDKALAAHKQTLEFMANIYG